MPTTEQTILKVGSEGGCIELRGHQTDGAWRFRLTTNETTLIESLEEDADPATGSPWVSSWEAALALLDEYPWQHLYPLDVHPEFHKQICNALSSRGVYQKSYELRGVFHQSPCTTASSRQTMPSESGQHGRGRAHLCLSDKGGRRHAKPLAELTYLPNVHFPFASYDFGDNALASNFG